MILSPFCAYIILLSELNYVELRDKCIKIGFRATLVILDWIFLVFMYT